jgi:WD40 repeat protein
MLEQSCRSLYFLSIFVIIFGCFKPDNLFAVPNIGINQTVENIDKTTEQILSDMSIIEGAIGSITAVEGAVSSISVLLTAFEQLVKNLSNIDSLSSSIEQLKPELSSIDYTVNAIESKVDYLATETTSSIINAKVDTLQTEAVATLTTLNNTSSKIFVMNTELLGVNSKVDYLATETTSSIINAKVDTLQTEAVATLTTLNNISSKIFVMNTELLGVNSKVDYLATETTSSIINAKIDTLQTEAVATLTTLNNTSSKIFVMNTELLGVNSKIDDLSAQVSIIEKNINISIGECVVTSIASIETSLDGIKNTVDTSESLIERIESLIAEPIMQSVGSYQINAPGTYSLTSDFAGQIIINSDFVNLNLNGYHVYGALNGIVINSCNHITINNGAIGPVSSNGIVINPGSSSITLKNLSITDCAHGIDINQSSGLCLESIDLANNAIGLYGNVVQEMAVNYCSARLNTIGGFVLYNSSDNNFEDCSAQGNGGGDDDTYGFMSTSGSGNSFNSCAAKNTLSYALSTTKMAAGFMVKYPESASIVQQCTANKNSADGLSNAYGIILAPGNDDLVDYLDGIHGSTVNSVSWRNDGQYLAIGGATGTSGYQIRVYRFDLTATSSLVELPGCNIDHGSTVYSVAWSPDGNYLAIGGGAGLSGWQIRIYAFDPLTETLTLVSSALHGASVYSVAWSLNSKYLAIGGAAGSGSVGVRLYAVSDGVMTLLSGSNQIIGATVYSVAWHPSGTYLAIGNGIPGDNLEARIYSFDALAGTTTFVSGQNHGAALYSVSWTYDGKQLAVGGDAGTGGYQIRDYSFATQTGTLTLLSGCNQTHGATVYSVSWSPNQLYLAIGGATGFDGYQVRVYEVIDQVSTASIAGSNQVHGNTVNAVAWRPDGQYLSIGGATGLDNIQIRVYAFNMPLLTPVTTFTLADLPGSNVAGTDFFSLANAWHPSGSYLAIGGLGTYDVQVYAFDPVLGTLSILSGCSKAPAAVDSVAWHPSGKYLAVAGDVDIGGAQIHVYSFDSALGTLTELAGCTKTYGTNLISSISWSPDGSYLAFGSTSTSLPQVGVFVFDDTPSAESLTLLPSTVKTHGARVLTVAWDPTGDYVAVGGETGTGGAQLRTYSFDVGTQSLTELSGCNTIANMIIYTLAWHPAGSYLAIGGSILSGSYDIKVYSFDPLPIGSLTNIPGCDTLYGSGVFVNPQFSWSSDGTYLAVGSQNAIGMFGVFAFNLTSLTSTASVLIPGTAYAPATNWSPTGPFVAVSYQQNVLGATTIQVYSTSYQPLNYPIDCIVRNNLSSNNHAFGTGTGVGIAGSSFTSMVASNQAYNNDTNYAGDIRNIHSGYALATNSLDNISLP